MSNSKWCKGCGKTVYVMDQQVSLPDGAAFHKSCFRCRHCNASLQPTPGKFSSLDGLLYCNPHFQLHHLSTSEDTNTITSAITNANTTSPSSSPSSDDTSTNNTNTSLPQPQPQPQPQTQPQPQPQPQPQSQSQSPAAALAKPLAEKKKPTSEFTRSPSKAAMMFSGTQDKCVTCTKTVYPLEKVTVEGEAYHKSCFRCSHGGCAISPSNYAALEGVLYCKHHFKQLFKEKGSYNHIMKSASIKRTQPIPSSATNA